MNGLELHFSFSNLNRDVAKAIERAIGERRPFGLTNGRVVSLFNPEALTGVWFGNSTTYLSRPTAFHYATMTELINGVGLALLSQREFLEGEKVISYCENKGISVPKMLTL
jgi:hypothetical protein